MQERKYPIGIQVFSKFRKGELFSSTRVVKVSNQFNCEKMTIEDCIIL